MLRVESSLKLFFAGMLRRLAGAWLFFIAMLVIVVSTIELGSLDNFSWLIVLIFPIVFLVGIFLIIYFILVPQSIAISHDAILIKYWRKSDRIEKNTIKERAWIQQGKHPGVLKISMKDRGSHTINLVALSAKDRDRLCKAILGEHWDPASKQSFVLDYEDWLQDRLLGSKSLGAFWNWAMKYSILFPLQARPPARRKGFIQWQRFNAIFLYILILFVTVFFSFIGLTVLLQFFTSNEFATKIGGIRLTVYSLLAVYLFLFLNVGGYRRIKLLKRIRENLEK